MLLEGDELTALRRDFDTQSEGLTMEQFVSTMMRRLRSQARADPVGMVANLIELFRQVDVNADGDMEWEEFSAFCIEAGAAAAAAGWGPVPRSGPRPRRHGNRAAQPALSGHAVPPARGLPGHGVTRLLRPPRPACPRDQAHGAPCAATPRAQGPPFNTLLLSAPQFACAVGSGVVHTYAVRQPRRVREGDPPSVALATPVPVNEFRSVPAHRLARVAPPPSHPLGRPSTRVDRSTASEALDVCFLSGMGARALAR